VNDNMHMASSSTPPAPLATPRPVFDLTRRFSVLSLICVLATSGVMGFVLSRLLGEKLLHRDAVVTQEFVQSIVRADEASRFLLGPGAGGTASGAEDSFRHFAEMPDVLRANVYSTGRRVIWSSDSSLIGKTFADNDELDEALRGDLVFKSGVVSKQEHVAAAQPFTERGVTYFEEIYVPVRTGPTGPVAGVVELYKTPDALFDAIRDGQRTIWAGAAIGGLLLYVVLIGIVRRADRIMRDQHARLMEVEMLTMVGEMSAAVAHAIRNPLSAIRTSVENALDSDPGRFREPANDIMAEVDRVEEWIRELLSFSRPGSARNEAFDMNAVLASCVAHSRRHAEQNGVRVSSAPSEGLPMLHGDPAIVGQVLNGVIANALDAMPRGGTLELATAYLRPLKVVEVAVRDSGAGMRPEILAQVFKPFFTTKPKGIGLGLALAKRMVERFGGTLAIESAPERGTTVRLRLPA
jgi:signal transduction histidine kinase